MGQEASSSAFEQEKIMRWKEIAKFFCGFEGFHTVFHAYLWLSGTTFTAFGITATSTWNIAGVVIHGGIALALGFYGWGMLRPWQTRA